MDYKLLQCNNTFHHMTNCPKENKGKMNFVSPFSYMVELLRYIKNLLKWQEHEEREKKREEKYIYKKKLIFEPKT